MVATPLSLDQMKQLLGRKVRYQGRVLCVVDVLVEEGSIVLEDEDAARNIQANQFGEAGRRAPTPLTIPVFDHTGESYHPIFQSLELIS